jgi:hypothetical protein
VKQLLLVLPALLLTACATSWPQRGPEYWDEFVKEHPPFSVDNGEFFPFGAVERTVYLEEDTKFAFKFVETVNVAPLWIIEVREDRTGFFIFQERMQDGSVIRARDRKVDFTLSDTEYAKVRLAITDSGFLSVRSNFSGDEDAHWSVGVRTADGMKVVEFNGGYPNEARSVVYGVYDIVVKPRTADMAKAAEFKPEDWRTAPENQPMK